MKIFVLIITLINMQTGQVEAIGAGTFAERANCEATAERLRNTPPRDINYATEAGCVETELQP